jgi:hypothetical protein
MPEGKWSGGAANRTWARFSGARIVDIAGDTERGQRLYAELAGAVFWCETCKGTHPLREIRECRSAA